jgi:hypothetical protein
MNDTPAMNLLSVAIKRENWELAALCIVAAAIEKVLALPPEANEAMLDLLAIEEQRPLPPHRDRSRRLERRHR